MESPELVPSLDEERLYVLVVEDEFIVRYGLADELRESGFRVVEANSADEAWKYLTAGGRADLIFSDVQMPGAMSGMLRPRLMQCRTTPSAWNEEYRGSGSGSRRSSSGLA